MREQQSLIRKTAEIRRDILHMIFNAKTGHTGGSLSSADILTVLYYHILNVDPSNPKDPNRDRFIMSKGHSVEALYTILADKGFFPKEELKSFSKFKSRLIGHPSVKVPGVEFNTGALGHGLSCSVGMALAAKKNDMSVNIYCLMGDGEQAEGSVWEAAMAGSNFELDNLTAIIDRNHLQISGKTENVMKLEGLSDKWISFGWDVRNVDGHDIGKLVDVFKSPRISKRPMMVIAETTKGKGVGYMEDDVKWHHGVPSEEQYRKAIREIDDFIKEISGDE